MSKTKKVTIAASIAIVALSFVSEDVRLNAQELANAILALFDAAYDVKETLPD